MSTGTVRFNRVNYDVLLDTAVGMILGLQATSYGDPQALRTTSLVLGRLHVSLSESALAVSYYERAAAFPELATRRPRRFFGVIRNKQEEDGAERRQSQIDEQIRSALLAAAPKPAPAEATVESVGTSSIAEQIKDVIASHEVDYSYDGSRISCSCGWSAPRGESVRGDFAGHLAEVLMEAFAIE